MAPASEKSARVAEFQRRHRLALLTLLFTDMVGSTQLKQTLGDQAALGLIEEHYRLVQEVLTRFPDAEQIERAGDSFFLVFARPSDAVQFALLLQNALRQLDEADGLPLRDRIGIHVGEVMMDADATRLLGGLQIDSCARLMALGGGDQILLSRFSFDSARQALRGHEIAGLGPLAWLSHGHYLFKGLDEPVEVCEVGEAGQARLAAPSNTEKAHRCTTPDGEPVLGWRPAVGQQVPGTSWVLERNLGAGGFGEVWLGQHALLKQRRVFKFCFRADRVRSLKREVTIFRLLRERVGEHPHIVTVHDVYLDEPPFYLVMDFVEGEALPAWAEARGGLAAVPLPVRLGLVAQVADALQAAHEAGVVHRDVKPSNVLVGGSADAPQAKLADFGIGQVVSAEALGGITRLGFTQTMVSTDSYSGTQIYLSPELLTGQPATARSDIYSLGVVLFQMIAGDFTRPLTMDWADAIDEPLLRDDLRQCFASDPQKRFAGAAQLAKSLRSLPERKTARDAEEAERASAERRAYRRGVLRTAAVALIIVAVMAVLALIARQQAAKARVNAASAARERGRAERALTRLELERAEELLSAQDTPGGLAYLARVVRREPEHPVAVPRLLSALVDRSHPLPLTDRLMHEKMVVDVAFSPDGARLATVTRDATRIWDAGSGRLLVGPLPFGGFRAVFTPDGTRLIVILFDARIIDATTGKVLAELDAHPHDSGGGEARLDAQLSPDGETLLTVSARDEALLWDARSGARIGPPLAHSDEVWCARFSPDGRQIVTGTKDGRASLWAVPGGTLVRTWEAGSRVVRVDFHPDGKRIAAGLLDGRVLLWDAATGGELGAGRHDEEVTGAQFSPDGALLFTTSNDGSARLWDAATGKLSAELPRTRYLVLGSGFSPDGMRALTRTADGAVTIRSVSSRELVVEPIRPDAVALAAAFSPEGARVATGCADGSARVWQVESRAAQPLQLWHGAVVRDVAVTDYRRAATAGADGKVKLWDLTRAQRAATLDHGAPLAFVRHSWAAKTWLTASDDGVVRAWDPATCTAIGEAVRLPGRIVADDFSSFGHTFAIVDEKVGAQAWDARTLQPTGPRVGTKALSAALTFDGRRLVVASREGAGVWEAGTGQPAGQPAVHKAQVDCVAVSADAHSFATGSRDGSARVWNLATGAPMGAEMKHGNVVRTVAFSWDNELLVTTCYDRFARLWDAQTGRPRGALAHPEIALTAIFDRGSERRVLTGGSEGCVRLWDAESGLLLAEPQRLVGPVQKISMAGLYVLAIGEAEHRAALWLLPRAPVSAPPWLADWAEAVGGRRLDDAGAPQAVTFAALVDTRQRIAALTEKDDVTSAAQWFFAPRLERAMAPNAPLPLVDYVRALGEMGVADAAMLALELAPEDARAWAAAALQRCAQEAPPTAAEVAGIDWASRRALALDPREPQAWLARGLALEARGAWKDAAAALDRASALEAGTPSTLLRAARARILARAGRAAEAAPENLALRGIPARDPQATDRQVDLSAHYNCRLNEDPIPGDEGNTFAELPRGVQTIAGVTWDVRGMVQLGNRERMRRFPLAAAGIGVGAKCAALHFLHAAEFVQVAPGTEIARYVIHYEDGARAEVPLCNGRELGDWWGEPLAPLEAAWVGANRLTRAKNGRLNLFKTTWTNPRPDVAIATLDFLSAGTVAAPFVVAISRD